MNLSDFELDVMTIVWRLGECSAPEVHAAVTRDKTVTYSTVKTVIDRLENKGAIKRVRSEGRTIYFCADVSPDAVQRSMLDRLVRRVFAGQHRPLFNQLMKDKALSPQDLDYLEELIRQRKRSDRS
jgi:BlaI family penicillinase repressor